jgi:biopolymer transport protein ExbD
MARSTDHFEIEETDKINVVPLADVSLVLLIVLMIMSPTAMQSMIKVLTPGNVQGLASKPSSPGKNDPLIIDIRSTGLFLNNAPINTDLDLIVQLRLKLAESPERPVLVNADPGILVERVVEILDLAKQNGAVKVSLLKKAETT